MVRPLFHDRRDAGRRLAEHLASLRGQADVIVLALPRGGVPVAYEVATALRAPMEVFVVRKLGVPGYPELAMGAIATGGVRVLNQQVLGDMGVSQQALDRVTALEQRELDRRERLYRGDRPFPSLRSATVVLVDDGIATGATMAAAVLAARQEGAARVVVAAPVMSRDALMLLSSRCDRCECVAAPEPFDGVGSWYGDFEQTSDADVQALVAQASATRVPADPPAPAQALHIPAGGVVLEGDLTRPAHCDGLVVFAHGSGSSRFSPRNQDVAAALNRRGYATLLFDLLTADEELVDRASGALRFDIAFLGERLVAVTDWIGQQPDLAELPIAYFGASTGAAAALVAAAARPRVVRAVVSRGGRPDLAGNALPRVQAPTLLIVGGNDPQVLALNRAARQYLTGTDSELVIVPHATHLFEEPGALEEVSRLASAWLERHVVSAVVAGA